MAIYYIDKGFFVYEFWFSEGMEIFLLIRDKFKVFGGFFFFNFRYFSKELSLLFYYDLVVKS